MKQKEEDIKSLTEDLPRPLVALLQLARRRDEQYLGTYIVLIVGLLLSIDITDHNADDRVKQIDDAIQDLCARGSATCTRYCNGCTVPGNFRLQNVRKAIRKHGSFLAHVNLSGNIWNAPRSALQPAPLRRYVEMFSHVFARSTKTGTSSALPTPYDAVWSTVQPLNIPGELLTPGPFRRSNINSPTGIESNVAATAEQERDSEVSQRSRLDGTSFDPSNRDGLRICDSHLIPPAAA